MRQLPLFPPEALPYQRLYDGSWDFRGIPASEGVYGIHPYPAMFHFMVVRRVIEEFSKTGDWILDPFMGSGVAAAEALQSGRNFIGYDLNPLAVLIARVRSTPISDKQLLQALSTISEAFERAEPAFIPSVPNLTYWFDAHTINALSRLYQSIETLAGSAEKDFFRVAFSATVRQVSLADAKEFKLIRRRQHNDKPVWETFQGLALDYIRRLATLRPSPIPITLSLREGNMLEQCAQLEPERFDLIITSPPYGDSRTTVAYGQFSRLPLWWLGMKESVDKSSLGSRRRQIEAGLPSEVLYTALNKIAAQDPRRAEEVFSFYTDLYKAVQCLAPLLKRGGEAFILVGNRKVCGVELPTDKICADFFTAEGYHHIATYLRVISNKRMPMRNSPRNIAGQTESTMGMEYLVRLRRG